MWAARSIKRINALQVSHITGGVLALLAVTIMLIPGMGEYSMWHDEVEVFRAADKLNTLNDFYQFDGFSARIVHPPLFFALLKLWMTLTGTNDFAMRALPALGAILTAAFVYRTTVDLSQQPAGGIAAAIVFGGMEFGAYYIHEVHNYSLLMTETAMMLFFYYRWWTVRRPVYSVGLALTSLMLLYTHYASIYLILAFTAHVLLTGRQQIRRWITLQAIVFLGYVPWVPAVYWLIASGYAHTEAASIVATSTATSWAGVQSILRLLLYDSWEYYAAFLVLIGIAAAIRPLHSYSSVLRISLFLLIIGAGSLLFALLGNTFWQTLAARRMIYLLVLIAVLLGYGFAHLPARWRWGLLALFLILTLNQPQPADLPGNWFYRQTMEYVAAHAQPDDAVYIDFSDALRTIPFRHYAELLLPKSVPFQTANTPLQVLLSTYLPRERVWVIGHKQNNKPQIWKNAALNQKQLTEIDRHLVAQYGVSLYSIPADRPVRPLAYFNPTGLSLPQVFGDEFELTRCEVDKLDAVPGEAVTINLDWHALRPIQQEWAVFLHLLGDNYTTFHGQEDSTPHDLGSVLSPVYWPVGAVIYDQHKLIVDPATPPGIYSLRLGAYHRDQGDRLQVNPGDGVTPADGIIIARIRVH